jgi:hypothetical protein
MLIVNIISLIITSIKEIIEGIFNPMMASRTKITYRCDFRPIVQNMDVLLKKINDMLFKINEGISEKDILINKFELCNVSKYNYQSMINSIENGCSVIFLKFDSHPLVEVPEVIQLGLVECTILLFQNKKDMHRQIKTYSDSINTIIASMLTKVFNRQFDSIKMNEEFMEIKSIVVKSLNEKTVHHYVSDYTYE